jgi:hypothetical protein
MWLFQFVAALVITGGSVGLVSLAWPRISNEPRPAPLEYVRDYVVTTPLGNQAAQILGVNDDKSAGPIDLGSVASSVAGSVVSSVEEKAQEFVARKAAEQLMERIHALPPDQQQQVLELLCTPQDN